MTALATLLLDSDLALRMREAVAAFQNGHAEKT